MAYLWELFADPFLILSLCSPFVESHLEYLRGEQRRLLIPLKMDTWWELILNLGLKIDCIIDCTYCIEDFSSIIRWDGIKMMRLSVCDIFWYLEIAW